jgi:uncharacterized protein YndB with AHSA1/START domain
MRDGTIALRGDTITFRLERRLRHPVQDVWDAITDPGQREAWLGRWDVELVAGGKLVTYHGTGDVVEDTIVRIQPPVLLEHTFWGDVAPSSLVTWELIPDDGGCLLVLTHTFGRNETAVDGSRWGDEPNVSRNSAGWHRIADMLEAHLDGRPAPELSPEAFEQTRSRYAAAAGRLL